MLKVLDHPLGARSPRVPPHFHMISRLLLSFAFYVSIAWSILAVAAQDVVNGHVLTQGLATLDSPQPNSVLNAGSDTDVSIDVSVASGTALGIDLLEVYLVSSTDQKNLTVSAGSQLLSQEPGSTVKHIHWNIPTCLQTGAYNLTLYETSHVNGSSFFAITPIPVQVRNSGDVSESCDVSQNTLQVQPQSSSPPPSGTASNGANSSSASSSSVLPASNSAPYGSLTSTDTASANATVLATTTPPSSTGVPQSSTGGGHIITVTAGDGDITVGLGDLPGTIVVEPSGGAPPESTVTSSMGFITIFKTVAPTATATLTEIITAPVTLTIEETYLSTVTASGTTEEVTVTQTILSTTQVVATQVSSPQQAGLLPINSGSRVLLPSAILLHGSLLAYVLWRLL
ncbi:hypothetical protein BC628DRAFT_1419553 [Trametes gibbosa]|nr:hypothetical protein BC628DRAFT_1419553 [Trametes gibbosa]